MKQVNQTNKALLRVLGLDSMEFIQAVDIALRAGQLPAVTVRMTIDLPDGSDTQQFRLIAPLDSSQRPAFNLDDLCTQARSRVRSTIEIASQRHYAELGIGFATGGPVSRASKHARLRVKQDGRATWRTAT